MSGKMHEVGSRKKVCCLTPNHQWFVNNELPSSASQKQFGSKANPLERKFCQIFRWELKGVFTSVHLISLGWFLTGYIMSKFPENFTLETSTHLSHFYRGHRQVQHDSSSKTWIFKMTVWQITVKLSSLAIN